MTRDDFAAAILPVLIERSQMSYSSSPDNKRAVCEGAWKWADMMLETRCVDADSLSAALADPVIA